MARSKSERSGIAVRLAGWLAFGFSLWCWAGGAWAEQAGVDRELVRKAYHDFEQETASQGTVLKEKLTTLLEALDSPGDRATRKAVTECCGAKDPGKDKILDLVKADLSGQIEPLLKGMSAKAKEVSDSFVNDLSKRPEFLRLALREPDLDRAASSWLDAANGDMSECLRSVLDSKADALRRSIEKAYDDATNGGKAKAAVAAFGTGIKDLGKTPDKSDPIVGCVDKRAEELLAKAWAAADEVRTRIAVSEDLARAEQAKVAAAIRDQDYLKALREQGDGPLDVVICDWGRAPIDPTRPDTLSCHQRALLVGGDTVSTVHVRGLPPGHKATIHVTSGEVFPGGWGAEPTDPPTWDLGSDMLADLDCDAPGSRQVNVYLDRLFFPKHRGSKFFVRKRAEAHSVLRRSGRESLSIVTRGSSRSIELSVSVRDGAGATTVKTADLLMVYKRWSFEAGGFFAGGTIVDKEVLASPVSGKPELVKVEAIRDTDNYRQESGAHLTFFPRNYPMLGLGLGFATSNGRAPSVYFGPALRLLSFNDQAVLTLSAGRMLGSVRRFPGLSVGDEVRADSQRLAGRTENRLGSFLLVSLGFQFGPVPGPATR